mmetsp:Transcript_38137/g.97437  ORF Transcript_38137/g.97437 Transcript_38137/m.97437 type:complete len:120 (+) Transcript_38137:136-495(+)
MSWHFYPGAVSASGRPHLHSTMERELLTRMLMRVLVEPSQHLHPARTRGRAAVVEMERERERERERCWFSMVRSGRCRPCLIYPSEHFESLSHYNCVQSECADPIHEARMAHVDMSHSS